MKLNIEEFVKKYSNIETEQDTTTEYPGRITTADAKVSCTSNQEANKALQNISDKVSKFSSQMENLQKNMNTVHGEVLTEVVRVPVWVQTGTPHRGGGAHTWLCLQSNVWVRTTKNQPRRLVVELRIMMRWSVV